MMVDHGIGRPREGRNGGLMAKRSTSTKSRKSRGAHGAERRIEDEAKPLPPPVTKVSFGLDLWMCANGAEKLAASDPVYRGAARLLEAICISIGNKKQLGESVVATSLNRCATHIHKQHDTYAASRFPMKRSVGVAAFYLRSHLEVCLDVNYTAEKIGDQIEWFRRLPTTPGWPQSSMFLLPVPDIDLLLPCTPRPRANWTNTWIRVVRDQRILFPRNSDFVRVNGELVRRKPWPVGAISPAEREQVAADIVRACAKKAGCATAEPFGSERKQRKRFDSEVRERIPLLDDERTDS
jgi:hypothetical protein